MNPVYVIDERIEGRLLTAESRKFAAGSARVGDPYAVGGEEVESTRIHVEQRVVREFLGHNHWWGVFALELAAGRHTDEDQTIVGREEQSIGSPVVIAWPAHEDLRPSLYLLAVVQHSTLELTVGRDPGLRGVNVTHEEEISKEKERDEHDGEPEERFLQKPKGAVKSLRLF